jgi:hypothetical protein
MNKAEIEIPDVEIILVENAEITRSVQPDNRTNYILLPLIFLAVTLFGGMRLATADNSFVFLKPELITLVLAAFTLLLMFRSEMISFAGWLPDANTAPQKAANAAILLTLFAATAQVYNSLLPEKGMLHWIFVFCFFWAIATNLLAEMPAQRIIVSLGTLFAIAFVTKYIFLASLAAPAEMSWLQRVMENPGREALALVIGKPEYSSATGYIQFLTMSLYLAGLYLLPRRA